MNLESPDTRPSGPVKAKSTADGNVASVVRMIAIVLLSVGVLAIAVLAAWFYLLLRAIGTR